MDVMLRDDDWQNTEAELFSVKKIRQYFARCAPLSAQDASVDGWRPREHIAWMFNDRGNHGVPPRRQGQQRFCKFLDGYI